MSRAIPLIMGILNVTPDSFSDGGSFVDPHAAIDHGLQMVDEGADWVDVGGESTRPGSSPVSAVEELDRISTIVDNLAKQGVQVSIDTSKVEVARASLALGAQLVNDVTGLRNPEMVDLCAETGCRVCIMHMLGSPMTMQKHQVYGDVVRDVKEYLLHAASIAEVGGVAKDRIWIDPGFGFGKSIENNLDLLRRLDEIVQLGYPVLVGVSRKSFLGKIVGSDSEPASIDARLEATIVAQSIAQQKGASILRVHDVGAAMRSAKMTAAILS